MKVFINLKQNILKSLNFIVLSVCLATTGIVIDHFTVVCSVTWPLNGSEACFDTDLSVFIV